jgi:hypothetical protein
MSATRAHANPYDHHHLLTLLVAQTQASLERQVMDPVRPEDGCFLDPASGFPNADHTSHSRDLAALCQVLLAEGSSVLGDSELLERARRGVAFLRRWQRPSGLIDLPKIDIDSPPDTAFAVQLFAPILRYARRRAGEGLAQAAELAALLEGFVASAGEAIIDRGFRTPNHRWVVCAALALAMRECPQLRRRALPYVESILAEGIDINADGEFSERSTGIYNAVNNRALRHIADCLGRPALLDHVRANLRFIGTLIEADGTVITAISGRQDRGGRAVPVTMADSFFDLAMRDGDGGLAWTADLLVEKARHRGEGHGWGWMAQAFLDRPELITAAPLPRRTPPVQIERTWTDSRLWFLKHGPLTAFASAGTAIPFALRVGDVELRSLRGATSFLHAPPLGGDSFEPIAGGVRLARQRYEHAWDLPLGRPVRFRECGEYYRIAEHERQRWPHGHMALTLEAHRDGGDLILHVTSDSDHERVPAQLELSFDAGGTWRTHGSAMRASAGGAVMLQCGAGIYHKGGNALRVALDGVADAHAWWEIGHLPGDHDGFRVLLNLQTPLDCRIRLTPGRWSPATPGEVLPL